MATLPAEVEFLFSMTQVMDLKQVRTTYISKGELKTCNHDMIRFKEKIADV